MIGRIGSVALTASDVKQAVTFYEAVLGLTKKYEFQDYVGFDCGGVELGVKTWGEKDDPRAGEPCIFRPEVVDLVDIDQRERRIVGSFPEFVEERQLL